MSPFIFVMALFIITGGLLFPTTIIMGISLVQFIIFPFIWLSNKLGSSITFSDSFIQVSKRFTLVNEFLGITICIWFPFWYTARYIINAKVDL